MRSPVQALIWETWAGHRRSWLTIAGVFLVWAMLCRILGTQMQKSDFLQSLCFIPMVMLLGMTMAIFNFTEVNPRKGFSGFPQRLFSMPVRTCWIVACLMVCGMLSVVALYVGWAELVFRPAGFPILVRWPATLLAAGIVFYQAIVWCMSGYRITRLFVLGFVLSYLAAVGILPFLPPQLRGNWTERDLTIVLAILVLVAYGAAVIGVGSQRRGGGKAWAWRQSLIGLLETEITPRRTWNLSSPERALVWMELRRSVFVLPGAILFLALLILGPAEGLIGHGKEATFRTVMWLIASPMLFAIAIGGGLAKPDFWSLELALPAFLSTRPISNRQIIMAKMKAAAVGTLLAYAIALVATALVIATGDPEHVEGLWKMFQTIYSPLAQWMIAILSLFAIVMLTWSMIVGNLWLAYSGRRWFYSGIGVTILLLVASLIVIGVCSDLSDSQNRFFLRLLPWLPWLMAAAFICKVWAALWVGWQARSRNLISHRIIVGYLLFWAASTLGFTALAWFVSPRVAWSQYLLILAALSAVPLVRIEAALFSVAWNRHR